MPVKSKAQNRFFRAELAKPGNSRLKQVAKDFLAETTQTKSLPERLTPKTVTKAKQKRGRKEKRYKR